MVKICQIIFQWLKGILKNMAQIQWQTMFPKRAACRLPNRISKWELIKLKKQSTLTITSNKVQIRRKTRVQWTTSTNWIPKTLIKRATST